MVWIGGFPFTLQEASNPNSQITKPNELRLPQENNCYSQTGESRTRPFTQQLLPGTSSTWRLALAFGLPKVVWAFTGRAGNEPRDPLKTQRTQYPTSVTSDGQSTSAVVELLTWNPRICDTTKRAVQDTSTTQVQAGKMLADSLNEAGRTSAPPFTCQRSQDILQETRQPLQTRGFEA